MPESFKVIIVGGSVAGLTLAHCLNRLGIDFEILEKGEIAPQLGASVGILPNGARILDQLGIFDSVEREIEPLRYAKISYPDGFSFESQYPSVLHSNFGYPLSFLERQRFLQILFEKLDHKDRVHTGKRVVRIDNRGPRAIVKTECGDEYAADLVVGADGVHSVVRSEMWRHANEAMPGTVTEKEKSSLRLEYACVYGISLDVPFVKPGVQQSFFDDNLSIPIFVGKNSKVFWFVIIKLPQDRLSHKRRFHSDEARELCESLREKKFDSALTFGDIWSRREIFVMTPLEEGMFTLWHKNRVVCIGDAIRKMAPNIGQGANMAMEDAAVLSSILSKSVLQSRNNNNAVSATQLELVLQAFAAAQQARTREICDQSEFVVRMQSNADVGKKIIGRYLIPFLNDVPAGLSGLTIKGAQRLDFIDLPARALTDGWHGSWRSILKSLSSFRPKLTIGLGTSLYILVVSISLWVFLQHVQPRTSGGPGSVRLLSE